MGLDDVSKVHDYPGVSVFSILRPYENDVEIVDILKQKET